MDKSLIMMPGAETLLRTFGAMPGGREEVIKLLKEGHLVGVAPGGGYEAQLATNTDYPVMWKQRKGFAVVAKEANVPIIPMFTENIREAYVNMESGIYLIAALTKCVQISNVISDTSQLCLCYRFLSRFNFVLTFP